MKTLMPVIKAILKDDEFLCGGIFTKEKKYAKKIRSNDRRNCQYSNLSILCVAY